MKLANLLAIMKSRARKLAEHAKGPRLNEETATVYTRRAVDRYRLNGKVETQALIAFAKQIDQSNLSNKEQLCQMLLESLSPNHLDQVTLRNFKKFSIGESFTAAMVFQTAMAHALWRQRQKRSPSRLLNSKLRGRRFAEFLGARVTRLYQAGIPAGAIEIRSNCVVKPSFERNSRGVFLLRQFGEILDVRAREYFQGEAELRKRIDANLTVGTVRKDRWLVEELVSSKTELCPLDVKFYTFYGRVALILEMRRYPTLGYNWYDASGTQIITGCDVGLEFKGGEGVKSGEVEFAEKMSLQIPAPFMRIDFLRSKDGSLIFCEFTPRPGEFERLNGPTDSQLGREYAAASARLYDDTVNGKMFEIFSQICVESGRLKPRYTSHRQAQLARSGEQMNRGIPAS